MWKNERYGLIKHFLPFFLPFRFLAKNSEVVSLLEKQFSNFKVWWSTSSSDFEYFNFQLLLKSGINHPIFLEKKEHHYHRNHFYWKRPDWVEILVKINIWPAGSSVCPKSIDPIFQSTIFITRSDQFVADFFFTSFRWAGKVENVWNLLNK